MVSGSKLTSIVLITIVGVALTGCGSMFVDDSYIKEARTRANDQRLSQIDRGRIYERAGDTAVDRGRSAFAAEMYFEAAGAYSQALSSAGDSAMRSVNQKCIRASRSSPFCEEISDLIRERRLAARPDVPRRSDVAVGSGTSIATTHSLSAPSMHPPSSETDDRRLRLHTSVQRTIGGHQIHGTPAGLACLQLTGQLDQVGRELVRLTCPVRLRHCALRKPMPGNLDSMYCGQGALVGLSGYRTEDGKVGPSESITREGLLPIPICYNCSGSGKRNPQSVFVATPGETCEQHPWNNAAVPVPQGWLSACHLDRAELGREWNEGGYASGLFKKLLDELGRWAK